MEVPGARGVWKFGGFFLDPWELAAVSPHHVAMEEAGGCGERLPPLTAALGHRILGRKCRGAVRGAPAVTGTAALVGALGAKRDV